MARWQGWVTSLSAALIALVLAGPPIWGAVSATIQHNEDTAHVSGDIGTAILCVRDDNASGLTGSDNDYANCITDSVNRQWTRPAWLTATGGLMEDDTNDALRTSVVTVVTQQGRTQTIVEYTVLDSDGSQTNLALHAVTAGTKIRVAHAMADCSNANSGNTSIRVGFAAATLPAVSLSGAAGVFLSHPGVAPGSGVATNFTGAVEGADAEDIRLTMDDPAGGSCRIVIAYEDIT